MLHKIVEYIGNYIISVHIVLAILIGLLANYILSKLIGLIGYQFFPLPYELDLSEIEASRKLIDISPVGYLIFTALARGIGIFVGIIITFTIYKNSVFPASIVGIIILIIPALELFYLPYSIWYILLSLSFILTGGFIALRIAQKKINSRDSLII